MDIQPTQSTPANPPAPATAAAPLTSDFQDFIALLTAQARYQDPLQPIDSTEYVSQLAQFSMLEQQVLTNDLMALQYEQVATSTMASLSGWVGMEARAPAPLHYDGTPITISPNPVSIADQVELMVRNEAGEVVQRVPLPVSADPHVWTGIDPATGAPFPEGTYSFRVDSYSGDELLLSETAEVYAVVQEAQSLGGETILILEGGTAVPAASVTAIRAPQDPAVPVAGPQTGPLPPPPDQSPAV